MEEIEIWNKVGILREIDFSDSYEASTFGNIRSIDRYIKYKNGNVERRRGVMLSLYNDKKSGYMKVILYCDGKPHLFGAHEVVMSAHNPNPNPEIYTDINHIDEDKTNNRLDNLEWTTHKENVNHGTARKRRVQSLKNKFIPIVQLDFDGNIINVYYSSEEINKTKIYKAYAIGSIINKKIYIYKDYFWIRLDEYNNLSQNELIKIINDKKIKKETNKQHKNCQAVIQMSKNGEFIKKYHSITEAAKEMGCSKQAIQLCMSGKNKSCKGYIWKY